MALIRILVDGYSLLHSWPHLARGHARHSAFARNELIRRLSLYQDACGTPVTIFFDGSMPARGTAAAIPERDSGVEVLYSSRGKTADDLIERAAHRFAAFGEVLAVSDDRAERDTVLSVGGMVSNCWNFILTVESVLADQTDEIKEYNRKEQHRFRRRK